MKEQFKEVKETHAGKVHRLVELTYTHKDGNIFTVAAPTKEFCIAERDLWIQRRYGLFDKRKRASAEIETSKEIHLPFEDGKKVEAKEAEPKVRKLKQKRRK